jgi:hypothetical protein
MTSIFSPNLCTGCGYALPRAATEYSCIVQPPLIDQLLGLFCHQLPPERPLTYGVAEILSCHPWLDLHGQSSFPILLFLALLVGTKASQPYHCELSALAFKIVALIPQRRIARHLQPLCLS